MKIAWPAKARTLTTACLGLTALVTTQGALAQFNTDALKSMQKEGHKILEEAQEKRPFALNGNLCLDTSGSDLVVRSCNGRDSQAWRLDDQRRLVADNGQCVQGAKLRPCASGKNQLWRHDAQKRLVSDAGGCLQAQGNPLKTGAPVVKAACAKAVRQSWN